MPLIKPRKGDKQQVRLISKLFRENNETLYRAACSCGWEGGGLHELEEFAEHEGIVVHLPTVPMDLIRR